MTPSNFRFPNGAESYEVFIDRDGEPLYRTDADTLLKVMKELENYQIANKSLTEQLDRQHAKVRRLMAALTEDVIR